MTTSHRKRLFSTDTTSRTSSRSSNRSTSTCSHSRSPPDLLLAEFNDQDHSSSSLDLHAIACAGMDGSYNGTPSSSTRRSTGHSRRSQSAMSDHSWTAGTRVRRSTSGDCVQPTSLLLPVTHQHQQQQQQQRPELPLHSYSGSGPRHTPYGRNSQSSHYSTHNHNNNPHSLWCRHHNQKQLIALFGFLTLALLGLAVYQHDAMLQEALQLKEQEVDHHILHAKELEKRLRDSRNKASELEERLEQSEGEPHVDLETQRKLFHLEHNQLKMQQDVQLMSKRLLKEK